MKKLVFGLIATVMVSANIQAKSSTTILGENNVETINCLKRKIDMTITDSSGGVWHIYGTVDVGFGGINGYDVTVTHEGHTYHFHGKMTRTTVKDGSFSTSIEGDFTEDDKIVEMSTTTKSVLIECNDNVMKENL